MCPMDCDSDCSSEGNQACCYFVWAPCITAIAFLAPFVAIATLYAVIVRKYLVNKKGTYSLERSVVRLTRHESSVILYARNMIED